MSIFSSLFGFEEFSPLDVKDAFDALFKYAEVPHISNHTPEGIFYAKAVFSSSEEQQVKPALVLLHGFAAGAGFFLYNSSSLAKSYSAVYLVDLLGFGASHRPTFSASTHEEAVSFFLDSLHPFFESEFQKPFHLLGHSLGGYLAGLYALRHPEKIGHLFLASPAAMGVPPDLEKLRTSFRYPMLADILVNQWGKIIPQKIVRGLGYFSSSFTGRASQRFLGMIEKFIPDDKDGFLSSFRTYVHRITVAPSSAENCLGLLLGPFAHARVPLSPYFLGATIDPSILNPIGENGQVLDPPRDPKSSRVSENEEWEKCWSNFFSKAAVTVTNSPLSEAIDILKNSAEGLDDSLTPSDAFSSMAAHTPIVDKLQDAMNRLLNTGVRPRGWEVSVNRLPSEKLINMEGQLMDEYLQTLLNDPQKRDPVSSGRISYPITCIYGGSHDWMSSSVAIAMSRRLRERGVDCVVISPPLSGHHLYLEQFNLFNDIISSRSSGLLPDYLSLV